MRKVKIITDSCADLTGELLEKYDIDYAKMCTVYEGVESPALLTWTYEEAHALYNLIRDGKIERYVVDTFLQFFSRANDTEIFAHRLGEHIADIFDGIGAL